MTDDARMKCSRCGYDEFQGSVHEHHIDRNRYNNEIENRVFLCANCHYGLHHEGWKIEELVTFNRPNEGRLIRPKKHKIDAALLMKTAIENHCTVGKAWNMLGYP